MDKSQNENLLWSQYADRLCGEYRENNRIAPENYERIDVKRGLRNADGTGVVAGLTQICNVHGYVIDEGEKAPIDGELTYRGISIGDLIDGCTRENRFGFEETIYLLLFGCLPTPEELHIFTQIIAQYRELPDDFVEDMIIKAPSPNVMNKLARSVLALYSYDDNPEDNSLENVLRQCVQLIARLPNIMVAAYQVKRRSYDHKSMYFHIPKESQSIAESILYTLRSDKHFTDEEAKLLDLCLILHAEHGGGNNSTFTTRVLTSSGTDTYSAIAAGIGSLKGPRHGGANLKVMEMLEYIKEGVENWEDEEEVREFLRRILQRKEGDGSGLIYGIGHAVYTKSDPRAIILKRNAKRLVEGGPFEREFHLLQLVEKLAPSVFAEVRGSNKPLCANVDLYSGMVYKTLGIPQDLFTPLFAVSRMPGWCAHRLEEMTTTSRIMRPAYKSIAAAQKYVPLGDRK